MIEEGILVPLTLRPIGHGATGAQRGQVKIGGKAFKCVVKPESLAGIVSESFAALVAINLGLPALQPVIVRYPGKIEPWFGAKDMQHPNLLAALNVGQNDVAGVRRAALLLASWASVGGAIAFDELIANPDRNLGNLLWDGGDFWLIDHARALGAMPYTKNKLASIVSILDQATIDTTKVKAVSSALVYYHSCADAQSIWQELHDAFQMLPPKWSQAEAACHYFIKDRLPSLAARVADCFSPLLNTHVSSNVNGQQ